MDLMIDAVEIFNELPVQHPNDINEFTDAIHRVQSLLALRSVRRNFDGWYIMPN